MRAHRVLLGRFGTHRAPRHARRGRARRRGRAEPQARRDGLVGQDGRGVGRRAVAATLFARLVGRSRRQVLRAVRERGRRGAAHRRRDVGEADARVRRAQTRRWDTTEGAALDETVAAQVPNPRRRGVSGRRGRVRRELDRGSRRHRVLGHANAVLRLQVPPRRGVGVPRQRARLSSALRDLRVGRRRRPRQRLGSRGEEAPLPAPGPVSDVHRGARLQLHGGEAGHRRLVQLRERTSRRERAQWHTGPTTQGRDLRASADGPRGPAQGRGR
mmetsp:Transcript_14044/g.56014  ORF Transcript_14044/g.56014 Transcript_14044/m.56014 type:complete len:272 (-) Transcript_14044:153-968(-)